MGTSRIPTRRPISKRASSAATSGPAASRPTLIGRAERKSRSPFGGQEVYVSPASPPSSIRSRSVKRCPERRSCSVSAPVGSIATSIQWLTSERPFTSAPSPGGRVPRAPVAPAARPALANPSPGTVGDRNAMRTSRSEEHTSELQSQSNLVCRLLLEKKKKKHNKNMHEKE